ncbi:hypothetical protein TMES_10935 [Thalassospira mesophila]|uniref:Uncharacterized protein n=1 Tax=Thalassospira mesophila TaxID=1293891 RepID=A0A1Y2KZS7_9PROT|nr:hypothetical protein TMES_10935 [Thalassospira mesophila]
MGGILVFAATVSLLAAGNMSHDPQHGPVMARASGVSMYNFDKLHRTSTQACLSGCEMIVVRRAQNEGAQTVMSADLVKADFQIK